MGMRFPGLYSSSWRSGRLEITGEEFVAVLCVCLLIVIVVLVIIEIGIKIIESLNTTRKRRRSIDYRYPEQQSWF